MTKISEALDQYTGICKLAIVESAVKLSKSFEKVIIEILLLYMVVSGRIKFTQLSRYGKHGLEIMGLGLINLDAHNCMMLRAHQTPGTSELKMRVTSRSLSITSESSSVTARNC